MPLTIEDRGRHNTVSYLQADEAKLNGTLTIRGDRNRVAIGQRASAGNIQVSVGSGCTVDIGDRCHLGSLYIHAAKDAHVSIGSNTTFNGRTRLLLHEKGRITIGAGCLFASEIEVTISDMHSIVDAQSRKRLNPARDVTIEDSVWICQRAIILKGSHIETGSIIGTAALVAGHVPGNSLAIGVPAKVSRSGVTWTHKLL